MMTSFCCISWQNVIHWCRVIANPLWYLIPAILMLTSSFDNVAGGSFRLNLIFLIKIPVCSIPIQSGQLLSLHPLNFVHQTNNHQLIYPSVQCDWLEGIPLQTYVLFHVVPFLTGFHLTLHHISMSWSLSLKVSFCCKVHFAIYTSERTDVLLAVEQYCTLFWHLCGNQFYELSSGSRFQPICSCYSVPLLRWHWGLYQKQLVETHQMQDCMICLMSCYSKLLSKGLRSGLNSLPAFFVVLMLSF